MSILYIVAGPEYWASIPQTRQIACRRVRFTNRRCVPPKGASVYVHKAEAVADATATYRQLVRETHYSESTWHYQLLLSFTNPLKE